MKIMRLWSKVVAFVAAFLTLILGIPQDSAAQNVEEIHITTTDARGVETTRFAEVVVGEDGTLYAVGPVHRIFIEEYDVVPSAAKVLEIEDPDFELWASTRNASANQTVQVGYRSLSGHGTIKTALLETIPFGEVPGWSGTRADQQYTITVARTAMSITFKADVQIAEVPGVAGRIIKSLVVTWGQVPPNNAPVCTDKEYEADEGGLLTVNAPGLKSGGTDADGDAMSIVIHTAPAQGELVSVSTETGAFQYRPATGFFGSDVFQYRLFDGKDPSKICTVAIRVHALNRAPIARDDAASTTAGNPVVIPVLANDDDPDGDDNLLVVSAVSNPSNGTVTIVSGSKEVRYQPNTGFTGTDTFTYTVRDQQNLTDQATVTVTVNPSSTSFVCNVTGMTTSITEDETYSGRMSFSHPLRNQIGLANPSSQVWQWFTPVVDGQDVKFEGVFPDPGTYTFQIEGTSLTDQSKATCSVSVTVNPKSTTCDPGSVTLHEPIDGGCHYNDVVLKWQGTVCARKYQVQVSTSPTFSSNLVDTYVTESQYVFGNTMPDTYYWRVRELNEVGSEGPWSQIRSFDRCVSTGVERYGIPEELTLEGNYPNPFNPSTTIMYGLPTSGHVRLAIYDLMGRELAVLVDDEQVAGWHEVRFTSDWASGRYLYRLTTSTGGARSGVMTLMK